jgi:pimeloyl-ACP methyl ester carboxylesterase
MALATDTTRMTVDGVGIRVLRRPAARRAGTDSAPPVLVLHGWNASIDAVGSMIAGLSDELELIALDFPGMGQSDPPPVGWSVSDYADLVVALLDQLGLARVSLLAHSFGGRVSIVLAQTRPERIARVVITGGAGLKPKRKPSYYSKVAVAKAGRVVGAVGGAPGKELQDRMRRKVASTDWLEASDAMRDTFRLVIGEDLAPRLPEITRPTLLIWGEDDEDAPLWMGQEMERRIPGSALITLPGAGHFAYAEKAGEFNVIASHFLSGAT